MTTLTVTEFARRCGVTRQTMYTWMRQTPGLVAQRVGGVTLLSERDQRRILSRPRAVIGRPKKVGNYVDHKPNP